jgi:hypothetical protein
LFSLGRYAIGVYLGNSGTASSFGTAGSIIALSLWLYYAAQIFFLGAEFTRQYARWFGSHQQMQDLQFKYRALNSGRDLIARLRLFNSLRNQTVEVGQCAESEQLPLQVRMR